MTAAVRNLGRPGVAAMAITAVDVALWDLKARLLGLSLAACLTPSRHGAGVREWRVHQLLRPAVAAQLVTGCSGDPAGEDEGRRHPDDDLERVRAARAAIGDDGTVCRRQRRPVAETGVGSMRSGSPSTACAGLRSPSPPTIWRGCDCSGTGYRRGWRSRPASTATCLPYFEQMLVAGAVDCLQADATRCAGITGFLRAAALCQARSLELSAHCGPSIHVHPCCAIGSLRHLEYFHDHARVEALLFDGTLEPTDGVLRPDFTRPGNGRTQTPRRRALRRLGGSQ